MQKLNAAQALRNAIEAEKAAERFYRLLAESTEDPEARIFLFAMADSENAHANSIETSARTIFHGPLPQSADFDVSVVESLPDWRFADNTTLAQAVQIAKGAEVQASLYYDALADCFEGPMKDFFTDLALTEENHAKQLDKMFPLARA